MHIEITQKPLKILVEGEAQAKEVLFMLSQERSNINVEIAGESICLNTDNILTTMIKDD